MNCLYYLISQNHKTFGIIDSSIFIFLFFFFFWKTFIITLSNNNLIKFINIFKKKLYNLKIYRRLKSFTINFFSSTFFKKNKIKNKDIYREYKYFWIKLDLHKNKYNFFLFFFNVYINIYFIIKWNKNIKKILKWFDFFFSNNIEILYFIFKNITF